MKKYIFLTLSMLSAAIISGLLVYFYFPKKETANGIHPDLRGYALYHVWYYGFEGKKSGEFLYFSDDAIHKGYGFSPLNEKRVKSTVKLKNRAGRLEYRFDETRGRRERLYYFKDERHNSHCYYEYRFGQMNGPLGYRLVNSYKLQNLSDASKFYNSIYTKTE